MTPEITALIITAISIAFFHTLFGPDHYLPFIAMSKSRNWSLRKTILVTISCGIGHVLGSIVLGAVGIAAGLAITNIETIESFRGTIAAWGLITFGIVYTTWGFRQLYKNKTHHHEHFHDGVHHSHVHTHHNDHAHAHNVEQKNITPWVLFTIFIFGPCEPLIPLLMYPAAKSNLTGLLLVTGSFALVTVATMLAIVMVSTLGFSFKPIKKVQKYSHIIAGITILLCGVSIQFLGL
jgi:sulfite exporter TauE/SafE